MDNKRIGSNLPMIGESKNLPALYNGGLPAEFNVKEIKERPKLFKGRTKAIKWSDFFEVESNKMVVFRIIPHTRVTNTNKRLWRAIHKMYEMYESFGSRLERERFKFTYREKDLFWFDVIFKQEKGQKRVEFYISTTEYQAPKLKRKLQNKLDVTIEEATIDCLQVPQDHTVIQELKYLKHDIFSLNTNTTEQKTPVGGLMSTLEEINQDGDLARLSICNEVESRNKWNKNASWAYEKMQKGKIPQRAAISGRRAVNAAKVGIGAAINEINDLITDTFNALTNVFFKSDEKFKKDKVIEKPFSLEDEINARTVSNASREKINQPVFKSRIRVAAHSTDRLTRDTMQETIQTAFADITDNNELQGVKIRMRGRKKKVIEELNTLKLSTRTKTDGNVNLMSTDEMAKMIQLPTADLQRRYDEELSVKRNIEAHVPGAMRKGGIYLGESEFKDEQIPVYMPVNNPDEFYRGYCFIGGQGNGKDTAIKNWVIDGCINHGISFIVPDAINEEGNRGMADGIRDALPPEKIIDIDLANEDFITPMDLTEVIQKLGRKGMSRFADEVIDFFGDMEGMARSKRYLKAAAKAAGGSLYNIKRVIEDEDFRYEVIEQLQESGNVRLANELLGWGSNEELGSKADAVLNRLDDFFGNDTLYDIFAQGPKQEVDFAKWMREGKVVILRIPNRKLGELATKTLAHWIALKVFMTRMLMSKKEQENGCFIVFNEPEQYATNGLTKLMGRIGTEGRKERFGALYAFHHWNKLPVSLQENLNGGGVQQFLFANDHLKTFEISKHRLEPTIELEEAARLPRFSSIVSVRAGGELQNAFVCRMRPPIEAKYDNSFLTKRHARIYGRSWHDLQQAL